MLILCVWTHLNSFCFKKSKQKEQTLRKFPLLLSVICRSTQLIAVTASPEDTLKHKLLWVSHLVGPVCLHFHHRIHKGNLVLLHKSYTFWEFQWPSKHLSCMYVCVCVCPCLSIRETKRRNNNKRKIMQLTEVYIHTDI